MTQVLASRTRADFEALVDAHLRDVHRYVRRRTRPDDVDDIVAETLLIAWRRWDELPEGHELPWLYRTAWNVLANVRRRHMDIPVEDLPEGPHVEDVADVVIEDDALARAWQSLSVRDREVLRLVAWEGLDGPGLADALGLSAGGAAAALSRARARFTAALAST